MWVRESTPQPSFAQYDNRNRLGQINLLYRTEIWRYRRRCVLIRDDTPYKLTRIQDKSRLNEPELRNDVLAKIPEPIPKTPCGTRRVFYAGPLSRRNQHHISSLSYDRNNPTAGQPTCERERWIRRTRSTVRLKRTKDTATSQSVTATHHDTN